MSRLPRLLAALVLSTSFVACAGAGHQRVPWPDEHAAVGQDRCRVYVTREDVAAGSTRQVRVHDGKDEIGALAEGEYLCWERRPVQGLGTLTFEGVAPKLREVENVFDLPREAGSTTWFVISIPHSDRQPEIRRLSPEEGRALIGKRKPARR